MKCRSRDKMKILKYTILTGFLVLVFSQIGGLMSVRADATSDWVEFVEGIDEENRDYAVEIVESDSSGMVIDVHNYGMYRKKKVEGDKLFDVLSIPGQSTGYTEDLGKPQIPYIHLLISLPSETTVNVELVTDAKQEMGNYKVYPVPKEVVKETEEGFEYIDYEFYQDEEFYREDIVYPEESVKIGYYSRMRGRKTVGLEVYPIQFNPRQGKLTGRSYMRIRLIYENMGLGISSLGAESKSGIINHRFPKEGRFQPLRRGEEALTVDSIDTAGISNEKIYIVENDPLVIAEILPIMKQDGVIDPVIIYDESMEDWIIYFLSQFKERPEELYIVETFENTIPEAFLNKIRSEVPWVIPWINPERLKIKEHNKDFWIQKSPEKVVVIDDLSEDLRPYGIQYACLNHLPLCSWVDMEEFIPHIGTISEAIYFGKNASTLSSLQASIGSVIQIEDINTAEKEIVKTASCNSIVTIIPSEKIDPYEYWRPAIIYAVQRESMLLTVNAKGFLDIDQQIDDALDANIVPLNQGQDPQFMVIFGNQNVIPTLDNGSDSADNLYYADRNNDYLPDISIGRILHGINNLSVTNLFVSRGVFFERLIRSDKAMFQTWDGAIKARTSGLRDFELRNLLYDMNYDVAEYYTPHNSQYTDYVTDLSESEFILTSGHGGYTSYTTYLYSATPHRYIRLNFSDLSSYKFPPSFWSMKSCSTSMNTNKPEHMMSVIPMIGCVNVWSGVSPISFARTDYIMNMLLQGFTIGEAVQYAFPKSSDPLTLYGDPLVK